MKRFSVTIVVFLIVLVGLEGMTRYGTQAAYEPAAERVPQQQEVVAALAPDIAEEGGEDLASQASVVLVLAPPGAPASPASAAPVSARVGQVFALEIRVHNPAGQPLDGVEAGLDFDPAVLEVVDATGARTAAPVPGKEFKTVLMNRVTQTEGIIDFAAGVELGGAAHRGSATLATVHFKGKAAHPGSTIRFSPGVKLRAVPGSFTILRLTQAAYRGERVPMSLGGATVIRLAAAP